jgi:hypothetical protein
VYRFGARVCTAHGRTAGSCLWELSAWGEVPNKRGVNATLKYGSHLNYTRGLEAGYIEKLIGFGRWVGGQTDAWGTGELRRKGRDVGGETRTRVAGHRGDFRDGGRSPWHKVP